MKISSLTLYEVKELSELLGVQPSTIRKYLREGKIQGRKFAGRWYIPEENVLGYFTEERKS